MDEFATDFAAFDAQDLADGPRADSGPLSRREAALARLMDRLSRQPDFPSLGDAMGAVRRVARSDEARVQTLASTLMSDVGLSHRVLRLANSVHYRSAGAGLITSLSRAIAVMGFAEIARLSVSSRLIDQLRLQPHASALREEFLRALLAGAVGNELCWRRDLREDAHVVSVFRNLGRMLACLHFPAEALAVRHAVPASVWPREDAEQAASLQILGVDYGALGARAAERWGWPDSLRRAIRHTAWPDHPPASKTAQLRCLGGAANAVADMILYTDPAQASEACLRLQTLLGPATGLDARDLLAAAESARLQVDRLAEVLEMPLHRLPGREDTRPLAQRQWNAPRAPLPRPDPHGLARGLARARQAQAQGQAAAAVQNAVLEALMHGLGARRAVLCLGAGEHRPLQGVLGIGRQVDDAAPHFIVPRHDDGQLFSLLCERGAELLAQDTREPTLARRLPAWWHQHLGSGSFLVLPLMRAGSPLGMLYADFDEPRGLPLHAIDRPSLHALRDLAAEAASAWILAAA